MAGRLLISFGLRRQQTDFGLSKPVEERWAEQAGGRSTTSSSGYEKVGSPFSKATVVVFAIFARFSEASKET